MAKAQRICSVAGCNKPSRARGVCGTHYKKLRRYGDPLGGSTSHGEPLRFIHEVAIAFEGDECLAWPFNRNWHGRGTLNINGKPRQASRVVCQLVYGEPPTPKHEAAHSCGNGHLGCVNPKHLRWATHAENMADIALHGTAPRGERAWNTNLKEADVHVIRLLKGKKTQREIAAMFNVGVDAIGHIHRGEGWAWVESEDQEKRSI